MKEATKIKKSFDIENVNMERLKEYASKTNQSPNLAINDILYSFLSMEPEVKKRIAECCLEQADLMQFRIDSNVTAEFHKDSDIRKRAQYLRLAYILAPGMIYEDTKRPWKKVIPIKDGHVEFIEKDVWVILKDINNPSECRYAGIVELKKKNGELLHGIYFYDDEKMNPNNVSESVRKEIYNAFCREVPDFEEIVSWGKEGKVDAIPAKNFYQIKEKMTTHELTWMHRTKPFDFPIYEAYIVREKLKSNIDTIQD